MDLFNSDPLPNLLPQDGIVQYHGKVMTSQAAKELLVHFLEDIPWKQDEVFIFGKHIITKRKVAWFADSGIPYSYSNTTKQSLPWTAPLLELKALAEKTTATSYNSCLLNLYHSGAEGMGWHSDDEKSIAPQSAIASMSFGAERKFSLKHKKTKQSISVHLENGSLLVMKGSTQSHWLHAMPKTKKVNRPRVNLTFRKMVVA